jgi:hypothetical protein
MILFITTAVKTSNPTQLIFTLFWPAKRTQEAAHVERSIAASWQLYRQLQLDGSQLGLFFFKTQVSQVLFLAGSDATKLCRSVNVLDVAYKDEINI